LFHRVVVNTRDELIAGHHRLAACEAMGWKQIPVTVAASLDGAVLTVAAEREHSRG
jgi:ParB-like chromosome segregation protein Spo0J